MDSSARGQAAQSPKRAGNPAAGVIWDRVAIAVIGAAVVTAYYSTLSAGFTNWDDDRFIRGNPLFQGPVKDYVVAACTRVQFQAFHPLHLLSYLPDRLLWPTSAAGFHALNLALFACALVLGFVLLRRRVAVMPALAATLLVGLHPLAVEPVAWIVGRKDILALLLVLGVLLVEDRETRLRTTQAWAWILACLACLAKTSAVVLPILLFAWLVFVRDLPWRVVLRRCLPFAGIAFLFAVPVPLIWKHNQMILPDRPLPMALDVLGTIGSYAGQVALPLELSPVYPSLREGQSIAGLCLAAVLLIAIGSWRNLPQAAKFALVAFVSCLLPVANITPLYFRFADRYALLAVAMLAWPLAKLIDWPRWRKFVYLPVIALLAAELSATASLAATWKDSLSLWQHAVQAQPRAVFAHLKLGETLRAQGNFREAGLAYLEAGRLEPSGVKGPAGFLLAMGERAESEGRLAKGTYQQWEAELAKPGFDRHQMESLMDSVAKTDCASCVEGMLWLALRMFPQTDGSLVLLARKSLEQGRVKAAMVYMSEVRDAKTAGVREILQQLETWSAAAGAKEQ